MWRLRREFCACFAFVRFLLPLPSDILARSRFLSVSVSLFFYFFLIFFVLVSAAVGVVVVFLFSLCVLSSVVFLYFAVNLVVSHVSGIMKFAVTATPYSSCVRLCVCVCTAVPVCVCPAA